MSSSSGGERFEVGLIQGLGSATQGCEEGLAELLQEALTGREEEEEEGGGGRAESQSWGSLEIFRELGERLGHLVFWEVRTLHRRNEVGGFGAGWKGAGERLAHLFRSTVVTLKTTPLSHKIMKRRWEKGQLPMLSPSLPA